MVGDFRIEAVLSEINIRKAIRHMVQRNTGCGYDGMYARELAPFWERNGAEIREKIRNYTYIPVAAVQVRLRKPNGEYRILEIPAVRDRMLQYAICNVMTPYYERIFSRYSFGFRPGRSTLDAVTCCLKLMNQGRAYAADLDIRKYFDSINQRMLIRFLEQDIHDKAILELIKSYLGMAVYTRHNVYRKVHGVIQGGPLSPLLANIFLHPLDFFLEGKRIAFVRYADDIVLLCHDRSEAEAALGIVERFLREELRLRLNHAKTRLVRVSELYFLGYAFRENHGGIEADVGGKGMQKMQRALESHCGQPGKGASEWWDRWGAFNRGWINYYRLVPEDVFSEYAAEMERMEEEEIRNRIMWNDDLLEALWDSRGYISPCDWYEEARKLLWRQ
ncbi:MAG: hypothetical protein K5697_16955 [Lachnospiraceae bacterium]|nr:hypothetical protein [Lachnospiraceae bacterium]